MMDHIACMEDMRYLYKILIRKLGGSDQYRLKY
jgi:hypothetical protein